MIGSGLIIGAMSSKIKGEGGGGSSLFSFGNKGGQRPPVSSGSDSSPLIFIGAGVFLVALAWYLKTRK